MSKRNKKIKLNSGMTYVELIVVLSIFSVLSSIVLFNYSAFQARVDIKNLANDIALKIVEAQKAAIGGMVPLKTITAPDWKPAFGIYFNTTTFGSNKSFIYFADTDQNNFDSDTSFCTSSGSGNECISKIDITKGNYISSIIVYNPNLATPTVPVTDLSLTFKRPNSGVTMYSTDQGGLLSGISYAEITISSPQNIASKIRIYTSGRIQVNI